MTAEPADRHLHGRHGQVRADGARRAHQDQERAGPDADLPALVPRRYLRLLRHEHRRHQYARLPEILRRGEGDIRIYPLPHMPVVKDLVPDLTRFYARTARSSPGSRPRRPSHRPNGNNTRRTARSSTGFTSASSALAARRPVRPTGGTATAIWVPQHSSRPIAGSSTAATRAPATASTISRIHSALPLPHHHELRQDLPEGS